MLERFAKSLSSGCELESETSKIEAWSSYVRAILDNATDANRYGLRDEGDLLLRSVQLMIRTSPLSVAKIDEQFRVYEGEIGEKVGALARILTGWYQEFRHFGG